MGGSGARLVWMRTFHRNAPLSMYFSFITPSVVDVLGSVNRLLVYYLWFQIFRQTRALVPLTWSRCRVSCSDIILPSQQSNLYCWNFAHRAISKLGFPKRRAFLQQRLTLNSGFNKKKFSCWVPWVRRSPIRRLLCAFGFLRFYPRYTIKTPSYKCILWQPWSLRPLQPNTKHLI